MVAFLAFFAWFLFFTLNYMGHPDNHIPAKSDGHPGPHRSGMVLLPFYAILRLVPTSSAASSMSGSIAKKSVQQLDTSKVKSAASSPALQAVLLDPRGLGGLAWLSRPAAGGRRLRHRLAILTAWYFFHFLVIMPVLGMIEKPRPVPGN